MLLLVVVGKFCDVSSISLFDLFAFCGFFPSCGSLVDHVMYITLNLEVKTTTTTKEAGLKKVSTYIKTSKLVLLIHWRDS